jgi:trimeric autotransporter adhesin
MAKKHTWSAKSLFDSFWFRLRNPQRVGRPRRAACSRLLLEQLEDRLTPSNSLGTYALLEGPASGTNSDIVLATGAWTATANDAWLHTSASGSGNGLAVFTFDANPGATRTGTLTIAGQTLNVTQAGSNYVAAQLATLVPCP